MALTTEEENLVIDENDTPIVGGFDFAFEDELSPGHKCSICLLAMRNPVQTAGCGHRFCESCLLESFSERATDPAVCPQDRQSIPENGRGWFRDLAWERDILSLRVKCKKSESGCDWTGEIRHYQEHFENCQFVDVTCEECDQDVQKGFLDKHKTSECPTRIVKCEYCEEKFEFWRKELHESEECTRFPLNCPKKCGVPEIPREEMESHVRNDCMMTMVACPCEKGGCSFREKRSHLKAHLEDSREEHLSQIWSGHSKATALINQVATDLKSMQEQLEEIEEQFNGWQIEKVATKEQELVNRRELGGLQTQAEYTKKQITELEKAVERNGERRINCINKLQEVKDQIGELQTESESMKGRLDNLEEVENGTKSVQVRLINKLRKVTCRIEELETNSESMKGLPRELEEIKCQMEELKIKTEFMNVRLHYFNKVEEIVTETMKGWFLSAIAKADCRIVELKTESEATKEQLKELEKKLKNKTESTKRSLKKTGEEISELKHSEEKLQSENIALKNDVAKLGKQIEEVKRCAANNAQNEELAELRRQLEEVKRNTANLKSLIQLPNPASQSTPPTNPTSEMTSQMSKPPRKPETTEEEKTGNTVSRAHAVLNPDIAAKKRKIIEPKCKTRMSKSPKMDNNASNGKPRKSLPKKISVWDAEISLWDSDSDDF